MLICGTSALIAFFDRREPDHAATAAVIVADPGPLVVSPYVIAELDYLVDRRLGVQNELAVLEELAGGAWELASFGAADLRAAHALLARYGDQPIGIADASLVVLAERHRTDRILTLDRRRFSVLRTAAGDRFRILPDSA